MALKAVLSKTDYDAIDGNLKGFYKAEGDIFALDLDGVETHPATRAISRALDTERNNASTRARELKELRDKLGDMTPEEAVEARRRIKELEDKAAVGDVPDRFKEQFEKAVTARVKSTIDDFENQKKAFERQIKDLNVKLGETTEQLSVLTIDGEIRKAALEAGLEDWAVDDAILQARQIYRMKDGKPVPLQGDQIIYGKNASEPKPISEWLSDMIPKRPGWVKPSTGGGAANGSRRSTGSNILKLTREQARDVPTYREAQARAKKEGLTIEVDPG